MRAPLSWLRQWANLPADLTGRALGERLIRAGLEVETVEAAGADVRGPLVVGRVLAYELEEHSNGKKIRWCTVDAGEGAPRGIVCGAHNFEVGDLVVVALPGARLPGDFEIAARRTYGHVSDGMICSARELGLGEDHSGILVLDEPDAVPGADAGPVLHLRDDVLDIAVTPDRGYCLSIRGLAREAAEATGVAFTDPVDRAVPAESAGGYPVALGSEACAVFVAVTVTGIDPSRPTPRWLARRVQLAGMRSISLAVDITNYVMLETGQPIHAYDAERLSGTLVARAAADGEQLTTLDDVTRRLDPADLVIADDSGAIGLAGVMGGATTELSGATSTVVIEAAHFDALTVARTSRRHKLSSEASRRFERGVDPGAAYAAARRVADLLVRLAGGSITAETVRGRVPTPPATTLDAGLPAAILGTPVEPDRVVTLLERLGARVVAANGALTVTPPSWRPDLHDPYDYVEEVGRLVGFDTIAPVVPPAPVGRGLTRAQRARRAVHAAGAAAGFVQVLTLPFAAGADLNRLGVHQGDRRRRLIRLSNPLSEEAPYLRTTLLPGLFAAVARNTSRGNDDLALFETGAVFFAGELARAPRPPADARPDDAVLAEMQDALGDQPRHAAAVLSGDWRPAGWNGSAEQAGWTHAAWFAETLASAVGLRLDRRATAVAPWHPGRCAALLLAGTDTVLGHAGELHPQVCRAFGLPARTAAVELDLDVLVAAAPETGEVTALSGYPVAKVDIALIVDGDVPAARVAEALAVGAGELCESIRLFDIYTGPQAGPGRKSLAFALRFRAPDRTLTDTEVNAFRDAAVAEASRVTGGVQRTA
ncbi:MAG: phenylalanine--tRNA ligase subunit beta [Actinomycetes bacterium]